MLVLEVASDDDDLVSEHEESKTLLAESFPRVWVPCSRGSSLPYILPHDIHEYASGRILNNEVSAFTTKRGSGMHLIDIT